MSIVILTWNSQAYITKCIDSVHQSLGSSGLMYEIFIVDNGSNDSTVETIKAIQSKSPEIVKPIFLEKNTGTTFSRNIGLRKASGQYICIMDSDVEVSPSIFDCLIKSINSDRQIGIITPEIRYPSNNLQKSTDVFPTITRKIYRYFFLKRIEEKEHKINQFKQKIEVDYAISALWLFRRKILSVVGLLDEKIFYSPEDVDYCIRVWKAGYKIVYDTSVSITHHTQEISRGFRINRAFIDHIKGLAYFFFKHGYIFTKPKFRK